MAAKFNEGDFVRIVTREPSPADAKNGTYYPYFAGLCGTVDRIYDDEVCVRVEMSSLPHEVAKRHHDIQESMKRKWLDGLSGEMRNRLTSEEKQFQLSYTILVLPADLEKTKPGEAEPAPVKPARARKTAEVPDEKAPEAAPKAQVAPAKPAPKAAVVKEAPKAEPAETAPAKAASNKAAAPKPKDSGPKSVTTEDLDAKEQEYLRELQKKAKQ